MNFIRAIMAGAFLFSSQDSSAQENRPFLEKNSICNFKFRIESLLIPCDITGNANEQEKIQVAEPGAVFTVVGLKSDDSIIIRFWKWKENPGMNFKLCYTDSLCTNRKYFLVPVSVINEKCIPRYDKKACFTAGTVLIPVKLRLKRFDFSKDVTLGPVAGMKFRLSCYEDNFISVLAGLGITSITVDKNSIDGTADEPVEVPALTPSIGCVFDFLNSTQAGLFIGWDFITEQDKRNLNYDGKMWISFGLGFSILTKGSATSSDDEREK